MIGIDGRTLGLLVNPAACRTARRRDSAQLSRGRHPFVKLPMPTAPETAIRLAIDKFVELGKVRQAQLWFLEHQLDLLTPIHGNELL